MSFDIPDSILFRPANLRDLDAIMEIERDSFVAGVQEEKELYKKRINTFRDGFLVAEDFETGVVGAYICCEIWHEDQVVSAETLALGHDPADVHNPQGNQLYIASFGTRNSWRGRKIGSALLEALEQRLEKSHPHVTSSVLIVSENWKAAHHIYGKKGYKEIGRIIDFFTPDNQPAEDAILMKK